MGTVTERRYTPAQEEFIAAQSAVLSAGNILLQAKRDLKDAEARFASALAEANAARVVVADEGARTLEVHAA